MQRTFALARSCLGEVLSAVEFCDRSAIDFVPLRSVGRLLSKASPASDSRSGGESRVKSRFQSHEQG